MSPEVAERLEQEAAGRRTAALCAAAAVVLQLVAQVYLVTGVFSDAPDSSSPGGALTLPAFYRDHAVGLIAGATLLGVGYALLAPALDFLYRATRARRPETPAVTRVTAWIGPVALGVGLVATRVIQVVASGNAAPGDYFAARNAIFSATELQVVQGIAQAGSIALAFAFILLSLNAMRVGLLTRFMGFLGILVGVLLALPQLSGGTPVPIQLFWTGGLALLLAGRWPGGTPPAWTTGEARPWPTGQELREQRRREAEGRDAEPEESGFAPPTASPHPASRKRKGRKRR